MVAMMLVVVVSSIFYFIFMAIDAGDMVTMVTLLPASNLNAIRRLWPGFSHVIGLTSLWDERPPDPPPPWPHFPSTSALFTAFAAAVDSIASHHPKRARSSLSRPPTPHFPPTLQSSRSPGLREHHYGTPLPTAASSISHSHFFIHFSSSLQLKTAVLQTQPQSTAARGPPGATSYLFEGRASSSLFQPCNRANIPLG